jgi:hypothetical protein
MATSGRVAGDSFHVNELMSSNRLVAGVAALWTIPGLASALETSAYARALGHTLPGWLSVATRVPPWYVWALATPLVVGLVRRGDLVWPPRARTVALHGVLALSIGAVHAVVYTALVRQAPINGASPLSFGQMLVDEWLGWIPVTLLAYGALAGVGVALVMAGEAAESGRRAARLEGALATAQLDALRAQIRPHFVFNVLNTIGVFVREGDRQRALRTIAMFGDALRNVLRSESTHVVSLADELAALRHYVEIEETRYEDRVTVQWSIDPALTAHAVPALIYQPVVENAFRHGVGRRLGASLVEIGARADGVGMTLWVRDSGVAPADAVRPTPVDVDADGSPGIGLRNTAARLRALYGAAGRVVLRTDDGASVAEIHIPCEVERV